MQNLSFDPVADRLARYQTLAQTHNLLPVKVSAFYRKKIEAEISALGGTHGPLYRGVYPVEERLNVRAPGEVADFVDDRANMPETSGPKSKAIIHKYADRVLFMPTSSCASHCLYCFRQDVLSEAHEAGRSNLDQDLEALEAHLFAHPQAKEVILSGGDPMMLNVRDLARVLTRLRQHPNQPDIRIHTRALVFTPQIFDEERVQLLAQAKARVVFHVIHPYEICDEVVAVLKRLTAAGVRLYNHFPLLRGINDHATVLAKLIAKLDEHHVRTLSIYVPEPIHFSAPYRISLKRLFAIQDELQWTTPSWINAVRFTLDSPVGKVRRENLVGWNMSDNCAIFSRDGKEILYPDFPENMDIASHLSTLLWAG